jgi:uncharacterized protein (TIGR03086 family)
VIDLHPATERMTRLIAHLGDDQLGLPTPCGPATVGDVVDHLGMFATNFVKVARKELDEATSTPPAAFDGRNLEEGWRDRLSADLDALSTAWSIEDAWQGSTWVGGMYMPADVIGVVALDELLIHGWDLSVATGQAYDPPADEVDATIAFVSAFDAPRDGRLFGPIVDVAPDASTFEHLLGLTGRDPRWCPAPDSATSIPLR